MPQPFILLRLVDNDGGTPLRISINAAHIQHYGKWVPPTADDYRVGIVNSVITVANGNRLYVRETPAEIQTLLAAT